MTPIDDDTTTIWEDLKLILGVLISILAVSGLSIGLFWLLGALPIRN